jgi:peptide chain release factor 2
MNTLLQKSQEKLLSLEKMIQTTKHIRRIEEIDNLCIKTNFWNEPKTAAAMMKEREELSKLLEKLNYFKDNIGFAIELALVDESVVVPTVERLFKEISDFEFQQMMSDPLDVGPCILSISVGSGGFEAADFVRMLLRMYGRFAQSKGFGIDIIDEKKSEDHSDVCIDNVSIQIFGKYAYGFFKSESGVHRLIRKSPFNAGNAVQTSFAGVDVVADVEDVIDIKIEDKDIEISSMKSSGCGGQHINSTQSAIRLKHLPSGLNIVVRNERDQHANRKIAFKLLRAKLYELEERKRQEEADKKVANTVAASFGQQVRTYSYTSNIVKDHRSNFETKQVEAVLDGDLEEIIMSVLGVKDGK